MRQTQIENMLKDFEKRLSILEKVKEVYGKIQTIANDEEIQPKEIDMKKLKKLQKDNPQENYKKNVEPKGLPITKNEVSTTKTSLDGKSPVDNKK